MAEAVELDFYFDPLCRWAWWASVWIRRVAKERPVAVVWRPFGLAVQDNPEDYTKPPDWVPSTNHLKSFDLQRGLVLARRLGGNDAVDRLYVALGNVVHGSKEDVMDPQIRIRCLHSAVPFS